MHINIHKENVISNDFMEAISFDYKKLKNTYQFLKMDKIQTIEVDSFTALRTKEISKPLEQVFTNPKYFQDGFQSEGIHPIVHQHLQSKKTQTNFESMILNSLNGRRQCEEFVNKIIQKKNENLVLVMKKTALMGNQNLDKRNIKNKILKTSKRQKWSKQENKRLLEFILLYPFQIHRSQVGITTIKSLVKHINSTKTVQHCDDKMRNLRYRYPDQAALVTHLIKVSKVPQQWVDQRQKKRIQIDIQNQSIKQKIISIGQDLLIEEKAHKLFIQNFHFYEALADREIDATEGVCFDRSSSEKDAKFPPVKSDDHLDKRKPGLSNSATKYSNNVVGKQFEKLESDDPIVKLRYCIFLAKYKKQCQKKIYCNLASQIYSKMTNFTEANNQQAWRFNHKRWIRLENNEVEQLIKKKLQKLIFSQEQVEKQLTRIESFYQKDFNQEMNAFMENSKLSLRSSDEEIGLIVQKIKQEITNRLLSDMEGVRNCLHDKFKCHESSQNAENTIPKILRQKLIFKLTIVFHVTLHKLQDGQNFDKKVKKQLIYAKKVEPSNEQKQLQKSLPSLLKKDRKKEKKIAKQQAKKVNLTSPSKVYQQSSDADQEESQNKNLRDRKFPSNLSENKPESIENQNDQIGEDKNESEFLENTVKKRKFSVKHSKVVNQSRKSENLGQKIEEEKKKEQEKTLKGINRIWSLSERIKITAFLSVNKKIFLEGDYHEKYNIYRKLIKYVGTPKCRTQYTQYLEKIKLHYGNCLSKAIEQEEKRYHIPQNLLQQCKRFGDKYKEESVLEMETSSLVLSSYPILMIDPPLKGLEAEIERVIRKGPFVEAKLQFEPRIRVQSANNPKEIEPKDNAKIINIQESLEYHVQINSDLKKQDQEFKTLKLESFMIII